jgi:hypothetical protein
MDQYVTTIDLIVELNDKYTEELIHLKAKLDSELITIGEETDTKYTIAQMEGKRVALSDLLTLIKEKANVENT